MDTANSIKKIIVIKPVIIILFSFLLVMNIANFAFVLIYSSYFFSGAILSRISIYSSQNVCLIYSGVSIIICALILFMVIKKTESKLLPILLALYSIIFVYPFIV